MTRKTALELLIERRPFGEGSPDYRYRTIAAWKHLQNAMGKAPMHWTSTPPPVTIRGTT